MESFQIPKVVSRFMCVRGGAVYEHAVSGGQGIAFSAIEKTSRTGFNDEKEKRVQPVTMADVLLQRLQFSDFLKVYEIFSGKR